MIIGLISDTHISPKKGKINKKIFEIFENTDLILHAGDIHHKRYWMNYPKLHQLQQFWEIMMI